MRNKILRSLGVAALAACLQTPAMAQQDVGIAVSTRQGGIEPKAIEILKAARDRLAGAKSMVFTSIASYESSSRSGPPIAYSSKAQVTLQRPDKLKVVTFGDGPMSEFYYDGKSMISIAPKENRVAVAAAPPSIEAALRLAYDTAAIYFPFEDVIDRDPYKDIAHGLRTAFYIGQSDVVGATTTNMVAVVTDSVFYQIWVGAEDMLPRRLCAVYLNDPARLHRTLEFSGWQMNAPIPVDEFHSARASEATRTEFKRPNADTPWLVPPPNKAP